MYDVTPRERAWEEEEEAEEAATREEAILAFLWCEATLDSQPGPALIARGAQLKNSTTHLETWLAH